MKKEIRFCLAVGEYWFLSPYSQHPVLMNVDGQTYKFSNTELYYQAMKFAAIDKRFHNIMKTDDADAARLLTKKPEYRLNRRPDFDKNKFDIMRDAQVAKFSQNPDAMELLLSTGDAILIKSCEVCYKCGFGEGSGQNMLGKILMQIRDNHL